MNSIVMVNLYHPCCDIDIWTVDNSEDYRHALGQDYIPLPFLRTLLILAKMKFKTREQFIKYLQRNVK